MQKLKVLDLFSGIGGFSLGLERTGGFETVAFCEIDPFCQKVLNKHWPEVPIFEDVRTLEYEGSVDVICGGFPCQPFSTAGKRKGTEDDRHLWPAMLELVKTHRPAWFIGENVAGLISMELERDDVKVESRINTRYQDHDFYEAVYTRKSTMLLNSLIKDLEEIGYAVQPFIIPAVSVDAKHRRDRIWIVGSKIMPDPDRQRSHRTKKHQQRDGEPTNRKKCEFGQVCEILANTGGSTIRSASPLANTNSQCGGTFGASKTQKRPAIKTSSASEQSGTVAHSTGKRQSGSRKFVKRCSEEKKRKGEANFPFSKREFFEWPTEPRVGRVADGIPQRVDRLKGLGNAVIPYIPEIIGDAILETEINNG